MRILITRHTQTELNAKRCYYGKLDVPINQIGQLQAEQLGIKLGQLNRLDYVITSELLRTQQTADIALSQTQFNPIRQSFVEFNERDFGVWEGKNADQVAEADPSNWEQFLETPFQAIPKNGESFPNFQERILACWDEFISKQDDDATILFVLHFGVLRVIIKERLTEGLDFWEIDIPAGEFQQFEIKGGD